MQCLNKAEFNFPINAQATNNAVIGKKECQENKWYDQVNHMLLSCHVNSENNMTRCTYVIEAKRVFAKIELCVAPSSLYTLDG